MGVVTGLLLLPVTGPMRVFRLFLEQIREEAEAVLRDEGRAFAELIDLSMRHNAGQLTDEEYAEQEGQLLERLNSIRDYRNELLTEQADVEDEDLPPYAVVDEGEEDWSADGDGPGDEEDWVEASEEDEEDWSAEPNVVEEDEQ